MHSTILNFYILVLALMFIAYFTNNRVVLRFCAITTLAAIIPTLILIFK